MSAEQRENLEAVLRQSAFPVGSDVSEQRRLLRELMSAQPLPADVTVTAAALGAVRTAEITIDGIEPRQPDSSCRRISPVQNAWPHSKGRTIIPRRSNNASSSNSPIRRHAGP